MRVAQSADVYRGATLAGRLERTPHGSRFAYDERFLEEHPRDRMGVALHLPPRREPYEVRGTNLHPFFANLLPEGARLAALVRALKTSPDDLLSMLVAAGADTVGDVSAVPPGEPLREITPVADTARLREVSFTELFAASIEYGRRGRHELATVPGVQQKISAAMVSFPVRAPGHGSLHILKLEPPELPRLVHDEHFFMRAAADSGIDVARCALVHDRDGAPGLLVERFDRVAGADGSVRKLHQEDTDAPRNHERKPIISTRYRPRGSQTVPSCPAGSGRSGGRFERSSHHARAMHVSPAPRPSGDGDANIQCGGLA